MIRLLALTAMLIVVNADAQNVRVQLPPRIAVPANGTGFQTAQLAPMSASARAALVASLPQDKQNVKGFTVDVRIDVLNEVGYVPVTIDIKSTSVFSADRNFSIRLEPIELSQSPPRAGIAADIPIQVSQGSRRKTITHYVPKWCVGSHYNLTVFEDGSELEEYQGEIGTLLGNRYGAPTQMLAGESGLNWLHITKTGVANSTTSNALISQNLENNQVQIDRNFSRRLRITTQSDVNVTAIPTGITDWRHFQAYDGVLISQEDLDDLRVNQPDEHLALRQWMMMGGMLMVTKAPDREAVLSNLGATSHQAYLENELVAMLARTAQVTSMDVRRALQAEYAMLQQIVNGSVAMQLSAEDAKERLEPLAAQIANLNSAQSKNATEFAGRIWSQRVLAGRVIGWVGEPTLIDWQIITKMYNFRRSPTLRRGVDPIVGDSRVRRWLIPGVAQPPVYTFMGLLGLFVVLVGPIAYRRTTKAGRGYLMFAIAPFLAITTTIAMFGYGVLADGFGTTARVRQLTWVDGKNGDAIERVRSTYFAGVSPGSGLKFPGKAEVFEYPDNGSLSWQELNRASFALKGNVRLQDGQQLFGRSFLPSRTQRQFVSHVPKENLGRLIINRPPGADVLDAPRVDSTFKFDLTNVVIRDQSGLYWGVDVLQADAKSVACERITKINASAALGNLYNEYRPIAAAGTRSTSANYYDTYVRDLIMLLNRGVSNNNRVITDGIVEDWFQTRLQVDGDLPNNSFIAKSKLSADAIAVEGAEIIDSVRYVFGTLP